MKKMLISFCMIFSVLTIGAQSNKTTKQPTQQDLDKALKDAQEMINMQDLPPEAKEFLKNSNLNPADITKSIQIDKATMDAYKNQPKGIINTDTIMDEEEETKMRLASIGTTFTQKIGPDGGVVTSKNGKIKLTIPKGALTKLTEIRIVETKNESPNGCGNSFNLLPDGLVFNKPVKLTLKYTHHEINGASPDALMILTETKYGDYEVDLKTSVDIYNKTVSSEIAHFSKWGFAAINKLIIMPEINGVFKGQRVKFYVSGWKVSPRQTDSKEGKLIISKHNEMMDAQEKKMWDDAMKEQDEAERVQAEADRVKAVENEKQQKQDDKEMEEYEKSHPPGSPGHVYVEFGGVEFEKVQPSVRFLVRGVQFEDSQEEVSKLGFYKVKDWKIEGDNPKVANLGTLTIIAKNLTRAIYQAPKIVSDAWLTRTVNIYVNLEVNNKSKNTPLVSKQTLQLMRRIKILEDGEFNYSLGSIDNETNDAEVTALQMTSTKYFEQLAKKQNVSIEKTPQKQDELFNTANCFMKDGKLYIASTSNAQLFGSNPVGLSLCIPNPKLGENKLTCYEGTKQDDVLIYGGKDNIEGSNTEIKRSKNSKGDCNTVETCHDVYVYLDVLDKKAGGAVIGSFSGDVYQDGDKFRTACKSSKLLTVYGKFSLTISDIQK
jgi:hypothetical protein